MLAEGTRLGPYEILSTLAAGGMGEVYRAGDTRLGREVAVKVLPERLSRDPSALDRFEREAKALAALSHPNIVAVYDIGQMQGITFVVMELLEGETLSSRLEKGGALCWQEALPIAMAIADGLSGAHSKGIIHRDLKPGNVFLAANSVIKILDFGLARFNDPFPSGNVSHVQTIEQKTSPGTIVGTVNYMSPEQLKGLALDARSDIFSFGCVLYEMLTGTRPFSRPSAIETIASILKDPISDTLHAVQSPLDQIVQVCLAKDAGKRFASGQDLAVALKEIAVRGSWDHAPTVLPRNRRRRRQVDSIAILPFVNVGVDPESEYLGDGITESIINTLSQIPKLRVMARNTVFRYKGKDVDALTVGRELDVRAVLTGRIFPRDDHLNIQAELIDTSDGARLWGEQYNRELCDLMQVQEDISGRISDGLRLKLVSKQMKRLTKRPTENSEAYRLYLKGRFYCNKRTEEGLRTSIDYFEQSIAQDPSFALAYAGLSDAFALLGGFGYIPAKEAYTRAKAEANKALRLDDTLAEAHTSLATVLYRFDWKWSECEAEFRKAIECNPGYATAHHWYGVWLAFLGRFEESISEVRKAIQLDPLWVVTHWTLGFVLYYSREYDKAIESYLRTLEMDSTFGRVHVDLGIVYCLKGLHAEAIQAVQKGVLLLEDNPIVVGTLGYVYGMSGKKDEAIKILQELQERSKREYVSCYVVSTVYLGLGEYEQAIDWLEKAYGEREDSIVSLGVNPRMDPLRSNPRFHSLLQRIGLAI